MGLFFMGLLLRPGFTPYSITESPDSNRACDVSLQVYEGAMTDLCPLHNLISVSCLCTSHSGWALTTPTQQKFYNIVQKIVAVEMPLPSMSCHCNEGIQYTVLLSLLFPDVLIWKLYENMIITLQRWQIINKGIFVLLSNSQARPDRNISQPHTSLVCHLCTLSFG